MEPTIVPEPSPEERAALEEALAEVIREPAEAYSEWWREGVREALTAPGEPD
jgi:hypothetical protein